MSEKGTRRGPIGIKKTVLGEEKLRKIGLILLAPGAMTIIVSIIIESKT